MKPHAILFPIILLTLTGCATAYNPATERNEIIFIGTPAEVSIGSMIAAQVSKEFKLSNDSQKINRVTEIGNKIAAVSDRKDLKYRFNVVEDETLNAFTTPGGYVYINSGVLAKTSDAELACVIGHEIGHVAARHIAKKIQAQIGYDILMNLAASKAGLAELRNAASIGFNLILLGYSREDELLADRLGAKYAYRAGYDPYAMITFLKRLEDSKDKELGFVFLRSHPYTSQRIKMLEKQIPAITEKIDKKVTVEEKPKQEESRVDSKSIASESKRPLKVMCPVCRKIFSGRTNYCPYDGAKLQ